MEQSQQRQASNSKGALEFLKKVTDAEKLSSEVQKGDIHNTVRIARNMGYDIAPTDVWDAITELQRNKTTLASNVPSWIIDRLRVAVHD